MKIYRYPKIGLFGNTFIQAFFFHWVTHRHSFYLITILTKNERIFGVLDRKFLHKTAE